MEPDRWVEVDLDRVAENYRQIRSFLPETVAIMGVVKAEAYGLGALEVARVLEREKIDYLAVTYVEEGLQLRQKGITTPILVFAPARKEGLRKALEADLTVTVASEEDAKSLKESVAQGDRQVRVHLKVDTGLSRFGLEPEEVLPVASFLSGDERIILEGVYTHFASAGSRNVKSVHRQFEIFDQVRYWLTEAGFAVRYFHCCNSAATLRFPEFHLDMVRVGTLLGGQYPAGNVPRLLDLKDPYSFKSRVVSVKSVPSGRRVGYEGTYRLKKAAKLAVIPVGYQDGLGVMALSHPASLVDYLKWCVKLFLMYLNRPRPELMVTIRGKRYPIRGKVFMQMCLVELPEEEKVLPGEVVILPVKRTVATRDVTRIYLRDGEPGKRVATKRISNYVVE